MIRVNTFKISKNIFRNLGDFVKLSFEIILNFLSGGCWSAAPWEEIQISSQGGLNIPSIFRLIFVWMYLKNLLIEIFLNISNYSTYTCTFDSLERLLKSTRHHNSMNTKIGKRLEILLTAQNDIFHSDAASINILQKFEILEFGSVCAMAITPPPWLQGHWHGGKMPRALGQ